MTGKLVITAPRTHSMIEIIETTEGLARLADDWRRLGSLFPTPLLQYDWFRACAEAFSPPERLHVVTVRRDGRLRAIAPLALEGHGKGALAILGSEILCEPSGFLYDDTDDLAALVDHIVALGRPVHFRRLPAGSPEVKFLGDRGKGHAFQAERRSGSPWLPVAGTWASYERRLSSKERYTLRRAQKRAEAVGAFAVEERVVRPCEVDATFALLVRIEASSWKEENGTSLGASAPLHAFFRLYMRFAAEAGTLRVATLTLAGRPAAFLLGVEFARRMWVLKSSFDAAFAHCSPGVLLMHAAVRRAFVARLEAFEFLGTDEPWLHLWTDTVHEHVGIHLYPFSLAGLLHLGSDSSSFLLSRLPGRHAAVRE